MTNSTKKVVPSRENDTEETRRNEEEKRRRDEELRRKKEEYQELFKRKQTQREAAEEASRKLNKKKSTSALSYYIVFGVLGALCLYVVIMMFLNRQPPLNKTPVIDDSRIEEHNQNFPWHQGPNKIFEAASLADAKKLMGVSFASHSNLPKCNVDDTVTPPESFDYRQQWPNCVHPVANQQKTCAASYAFALTQTLSERLCITSKDQRLRHLSAQELVSCDVQNSGCKGGNLNVALDYMKAKGVVEESCFPYEAEEVKCDKMCSNPTRERVDSYCILFGEDDIKREVYKNGPVVAVTLVHVDFLTYKSGVYHKGDEVPKFSGYHAVKIVGWGVESGSENEPNKGNKYWIVQNSFGEEWGEGGYAKISVGQELMFDQYAYSMRVRGETLQKVAEATTTSTEQKDASLDLDDEVLDDKKDTATKA